MAKEKPKNGRRTTSLSPVSRKVIRGTRARPPGPQHKPTGKKDPGGFKAKGFKSEGFQSGKKTPKTGPPPSVRAREEKRAKQPPPVKYAGKKKPPKMPDWGDMPWPPKGAPWVNPDAPRPRPKPRPTPKPGPKKPGSAKPRPGPRKPSKGSPKIPMGKNRPSGAIDRPK